MSGTNIGDFNNRVDRIQRARKDGYGHEAAGTLGRSHYTKPAPLRRSIVRPMLFTLACFFLFKGMIYSQSGAELYNQRAADLMASEGIDWVAGELMQEDPVTSYLAQKIDQLRGLRLLATFPQSYR